MRVVGDPTIPDRYARAVFNIAKREGNLKQLLEETEQLLPLFAGDGRFRVFLESPQIPTEDKEKVLAKAFGGKIQPLLEHLLFMLLRKSRIEYAPAILDEVRLFAERDQGIHEGTVATAVEISDSDKKRLQTALEEYTKSKLRINWRVEPTLIGGVRFRSGDTLIDDSVKGKLERLRQQLQTAAAA